MAEFFLKSDMPEKAIVYEKCIENFYKAFDFKLHLQYEKCHIPFEGKALHCLKFSPSNAIGTVLVCGGYFALRSAAYDKRITAMAAYDVMDNGLEVMTNVFPEPIRSVIRFSRKCYWQGVLNKLVNITKKKSILADWAISQGLHITGTKTPYEFFQSLSFHNLASVTELLTQDILLLAGEEDHYIPQNQFYRLKASIYHAKSLTCRLFTKAEDGEQHCQIGNHQLAINEISDWLDCYFVQYQS